MPQLTKEEMEWFQKKRKQEKKQKLYDRMVRIKDVLMIQKAKAAKIAEPTDEEVLAEIKRRIDNGSMKPL